MRTFAVIATLVVASEVNAASVWFSLPDMSHIEMKDSAGNTKLVPMPSAHTYTFFLRDFNRQSQRPAPVKAIYFVGKQGGELSADDLKKHPEVKVVPTFRTCPAVFLGIFC